MSSAELLALQAAFVARLETMTAFLGTAMDFITAADHKLTDDERAGFHYCVEALRRNERGVIDLDRMIQEMEAANG